MLGQKLFDDTLDIYVLDMSDLSTVSSNGNVSCDRKLVETYMRNRYLRDKYSMWYHTFLCLSDFKYKITGSLSPIICFYL